MSRFEHPYVLVLVPIAAVLLGLSAVAQALGANQVAGFLVLYSMAALIICSIGYAALLTLKYSTRILQQWRMQRSEMN
ncbi:hypothetical protein [Halocatena salina]|uniref:Uncharacterized protein n=1 Tax=Halocatena salina TaxID=2934340 RepID=A0A8U0A4S0_9EURY|nr:hypothetical protein [Halocatena salina]UPM44200.1 hypothetical protein MW046_14375 [Halocatena salina]